MASVNGIIKAKDIPIANASEILATSTFMFVTNTGDLKRLLRTDLYNHLSTIAFKGDKGDKGDRGLTGSSGERGLKGDKGDKGDTGARGERGLAGIKGDTGAKGDTGNKGDTGLNGWTPMLGLSSVNGNVYITVTDWENMGGATSSKPPFPRYISSNGLTSNINEAINIKGVKGDKGDKGDIGVSGWTPLLELVEDDSKFYLYVSEWVNGEGTPPDIGYVSSEGITEEPVEDSDINFTADWSKIVNTPTTVAGYGITDLPQFLNQDGNPENNVVAPKGSFYTDNLTGELYIKTLTDDNVNWKKVTLT